MTGDDATASARWSLQRRIFDQALEAPPHERPRVVRDLCHGDAALELELLDLLRAAEETDPALDGLRAGPGEIVVGGRVVPSQIGPYQVLGELGQGGMGVVLLAKRQDGERPVAIKLLRSARVSADDRERFHREQRALERLVHPSICRLYSSDVLGDGSPYFVMEHVDGVPITTYCERQGCSLAERLALFRQLCVAVRSAHRHSLIHRDIKPSNILVVSDEDGQPLVKLLDFGIAKPTDDDAALTRAGTEVMTPEYASPEQLRRRPLDVATDVYSLGVVLYELLTGTRPHASARALAYAASTSVGWTDPEPPSARSRSAPSAPPLVATTSRQSWRDLDVLCRTALHEEPEQRYLTVDQLLQDLDCFLDQKPLQARHRTFRYVAGKLLRRHWRIVAGASAATALVIALALTYTHGLTVARDDALAAARRSQRAHDFVLALFEGDDPELLTRQGFTVEMLVERGVREAEGLHNDPELRAELYQTWGSVLHKLARFDRADELLGQALTLRQAVHGDQDPEVGSVLIALARLRADQERLQEARHLASQGLELISDGLSREHPHYAEALTANGIILTRTEDYEGAIATLQAAMRLQERGDVPTSLLETIGALADAYWYRGAYADADLLYRRRLELVESRLGVNHPDYASTLGNLGASREALGHYTEAESLLRQALAIHETYYGSQHPAVASDLSRLGTVLIRQDRLDAAQGVLERSLAIREVAYGPDHAAVAMSLNHLAHLQISHRTPEGLAIAEGLFDRERAIYERTADGPSQRLAVAYSNLTTIHFKRGRLDLAEQTQRQASEMLAALLPDDHIELAISRIKLGQVLTELGRHREALEPLLLAHAALEPQVSPTHPWLEAARSEIATIYDALGAESDAARYRTPAAP